MIWYGIESAVPDGLGRDGALLQEAAIPIVREHVARAMAASSGDPFHRVVAALGGAQDPGRRDILRGILTATRGRKSATPPGNWTEIRTVLWNSEDRDVRRLATSLALWFGDTAAAERLRSEVLDDGLSVEVRGAALETLLERPGEDLLPLLKASLDDPPLRGIALRGLAAFSDEEIPELILSRYARLSTADRPTAISVLAARESFVVPLLQAVENGTIPRTDLSTYTVRQLRRYGDSSIAAALQRIWGVARAVREDKKGTMERFKSQLTPTVLQAADLAAGRQVFRKNCATCHRLFDEGGAIGPDITGSQRANLDYVLENLADPSAFVPNEYRLRTISDAAGRVLQGIIKEQFHDARWDARSPEQ
jgi:mono/diheme cytochrome c family protein